MYHEKGVVKEDMAEIRAIFHISKWRTMGSVFHVERMLLENDNDKNVI